MAVVAQVAAVQVAVARVEAGASTAGGAAAARVAHEARQRGSDISARTVRRRLSTDFHLVTRRPAKKLMMTAKQLKARIKFCKTHTDKSADWWE